MRPNRASTAPPSAREPLAETAPQAATMPAAAIGAVGSVRITLQIIADVPRVRGGPPHDHRHDPVARQPCRATALANPTRARIR